MKTFTFNVDIIVIDEGAPVRQHFETVEAETVDRAEQIAIQRYCAYWGETPQSFDKHRSRLVFTTKLIDNTDLPLLNKQIEFRGF